MKRLSTTGLGTSVSGVRVVVKLVPPSMLGSRKDLGAVSGGT